MVLLPRPPGPRVSNPGIRVVDSREPASVEVGLTVRRLTGAGDTTRLMEAAAPRGLAAVWPRRPDVWGDPRMPAVGADPAPHPSTLHRDGAPLAWSGARPVTNQTAGPLRPLLRGMVTETTDATAAPPRLVFANEVARVTLRVNVGVAWLLAGAGPAPTIRPATAVAVDGVDVDAARDGGTVGVLATSSSSPLIGARAPTPLETEVPVPGSALPLLLVIPPAVVGARLGGGRAVVWPPRCGSRVGRPTRLGPPIHVASSPPSLTSR